MKKIAFVSLLILALSVPIFAATAFSFTKPLCSFPFGRVIYDTLPNGSPVAYAGSFFVQYDGRFYDDSYEGQNSLPNGGIKFGLELGYYHTPEERDAAVSQVISLTFVNTSIGETLIITQPYKYFLTDRYMNTSHVADLTFWFGNASNAVGKWKMYLVHKSGIYSTDFEVTKDMILLSQPPIAVDITLLENDAVCFNKNGSSTDYRVRIFDQENNIISDWKPNLMDYGKEICTPPYANPGYYGRVEARMVSNYWIVLGPRLVKNATGSWVWNEPCSVGFLKDMNSRACTYFRLD